jgi:hypothetical protein
MPTGQNSAPLTDQPMEMWKEQLTEPSKGRRWVQRMGQMRGLRSVPPKDLPTAR